MHVWWRFVCVGEGASTDFLGNDLASAKAPRSPLSCAAITVIQKIGGFQRRGF